MSIRRRQEPIQFPFDLPTANPELRMAATSKIWGYAMGMLGISIPLAAITESAAIPIVVVLMAGCSTIAIWINPANSSSTTLDQEKVKQLEERLANLETIVSYEEPMLRSKIENLRSFTD
jgi:hypothetical protein